MTSRGSISISRARARPALFSPVAMEWQECRYPYLARQGFDVAFWIAITNWGNYLAGILAHDCVSILLLPDWIGPIQYLLSRGVRRGQVHF
jgi:hypothetical protein